MIQQGCKLRRGFLVIFVFLLSLGFFSTGLATNLLLRLVWDFASGFQAREANFADMLLDAFRTHEVLNFLGDLVPWECDAQAGADSVNAEEQELVSVGYIEVSSERASIEGFGQLLTVPTHEFAWLCWRIAFRLLLRRGWLPVAAIGGWSWGVHGCLLRTGISVRLCAPLSLVVA
jgi:hypothetical protein